MVTAWPKMPPPRRMRLGQPQSERTAMTCLQSPASLLVAVVMAGDVVDRQVVQRNSGIAAIFIHTRSLRFCKITLSGQRVRSALSNTQ